MNEFSAWTFEKTKKFNVYKIKNEIADKYLVYQNGNISLIDYDRPFDNEFKEWLLIEKNTNQYLIRLSTRPLYLTDTFDTILPSKLYRGDQNPLLQIWNIQLDKTGSSGCIFELFNFEFTNKYFNNF